MPFSREECTFQSDTETPYYVAPAKPSPKQLPGEQSVKKTVSNANYGDVQFLKLI